MEDHAAWFEEWVLDMAGGPFPPYELITGTALAVLRDVFDAHGIALWGDLGVLNREHIRLVDIAEDERECLEAIMASWSNERDHIYVHWTNDAETFGAIARIRREHIVKYAEGLWYGFHHDLCLFDASLTHFVVIKAKGSAAHLDLAEYQHLCARTPRRKVT